MAKKLSTTLTTLSVNVLAVANGGTGVSTIPVNSVVLGNGTNGFQSIAPGTAGNVLTSNGTTWVSSPAPISLPTQTGNTGKFLTTDGSTASWVAQTSTLPIQTSNSGKYLTTDGTSAAWVALKTGLSATTLKAAGYTAVANDLVRCNTTAGSFSVTLPVSPNDGDVIGILDTYNTFGTNALTVLPNGNSIESDTTSYLLDISGTYVALIYNLANTNWQILDTPQVLTAGAGAALPTQTSNSGKYLTTDGSTPSWSSIITGLQITVTKTANYTATTNSLIRSDTTSGAFTITLPASPTDGATVGVIDIASTFGTNALTVASGAGATVEGDTSVILNVNHTYAEFIYSASTTNWLWKGTPSSGSSSGTSVGKSMVLSIIFG
jgi:hypothetical protein